MSKFQEDIDLKLARLYTRNPLKKQNIQKIQDYLGFLKQKNEERLGKQRTLIFLRHKFGTTQVYDRKQILNRSVNMRRSDLLSKFYPYQQETAMQHNMNLEQNKNVPEATLSRSVMSRKSSVDTKLLEKALENPEQTHQRKDDNRIKNMVEEFFDRRKLTLNDNSKPKTASQGTRNRRIGVTTQNIDNQKIKFTANDSQVDLSKTAYVSFKNGRVVPEVYKKQREERLNRTLGNLKRELAYEKNEEVNRSQLMNSKFTKARESCSPFINRTLRDKDTFISVFPAYGVRPDQKDSEVQREFIYKEYDPIEQRNTNSPDKMHFLKRDEIKRYTEEWLKTANMRGRK